MSRDNISHVVTLTHSKRAGAHHDLTGDLGNSAIVLAIFKATENWSTGDSGFWLNRNTTYTMANTPSFSNGDVVMVTIDTVSKKLTFKQGGSGGLSGELTPCSLWDADYYCAGRIAISGSGNFYDTRQAVLRWQDGDADMFVWSNHGSSFISNITLANPTVRQIMSQTGLGFTNRQNIVANDSHIFAYADNGYMYRYAWDGTVEYSQSMTGTTFHSNCPFYIDNDSRLWYATTETGAVKCYNGPERGYGVAGILCGVGDEYFYTMEYNQSFLSIHPYAKSTGTKGSDITISIYSSGTLSFTPHTWQNPEHNIILLDKTETIGSTATTEVVAIYNGMMIIIGEINKVKYVDGVKALIVQDRNRVLRYDYLNGNKVITAYMNDIGELSLAPCVIDRTGNSTLVFWSDKTHLTTYYGLKVT